MSKKRLAIISVSVAVLIALAIAVPLVLMNKDTSQNGEPVNYSMEVKQAVIDEAMSIIEPLGYWPEIVAALGFGADHIVLGFYGEAVPEVVGIVQSVIDDKTPGLPLEIVETITVVTVSP